MSIEILSIDTLVGYLLLYLTKLNIKFLFISLVLLFYLFTSLKLFNNTELLCGRTQLQ